MTATATTASSPTLSNTNIPPSLLTAPGKRRVRLGDLKLECKDWKNPRQFTGLDQEKIRQFAAEIKERGILVDILVQMIKDPSAPGGFLNLVIDGQRRVIAGRQVLPPDTLIEVQDRTPEPVALTPALADTLTFEVLAIFSNREGLSSYELSAVAEDMRKRDNKLEKIAATIQKSPSWISKMLTARKNATPELMTAWKKGEVTDEQFKDLAEAKGDKQRDQVKQAVDLRQSGNKAEARAAAKETATLEKQTKRQDPKPDPKPGKDAKPQLTLPETKPAGKDPKVDAKPEKPVPVKKPTPSRSALEDIVLLSTKRPATHDYVKGLIDGVKYALGAIEAKDFAPAWQTYLARITGAPVPKRGGKKPAKVAKVAKAKAAKPAKAKPAKVVKGGGKKSSKKKR